MTYEEWQTAMFEEIDRMGYPATQPISRADLRAWLRESVPPLVLRLIVCGRAVKVCSTISPIASQVALERGVPILVRQVPGHFYNVALTHSNPIKIDLSAVQLEVSRLADELEEEDEDDPFGEEAAIYELLKRVARNPFAAVSIEALPRRPLERGLAVPYGESFDYALAQRYVERLRRGRRSDALEELALLEEDPSAMETSLA